MYMGETKPHKKLSAMPVLLLVWLPYDVITLDSFTLKSNRGQAIQQCFRNMFTGIPTITHFWHIIQNTETERERESHAGIITHGDHILLALIVAELVSGMVQQFVFNPSDSPNHKVKKSGKGLLDGWTRCVSSSEITCVLKKAMYPVIHVHLEGSSKEHAGKNGCLVQ